MDTHEVFDPATGKWTDLAPLPRKRDHVAIVAAEGRIHVIGGRFVTPAEGTNMHDVYDPASNTWTSAAPLLTIRSGGAGVVYKGRILVFGGECNAGVPFVHNEAFDLKTKTWSTRDALGRHGINRGRRRTERARRPKCATAASDTLLTFRLP